jgi:hypothetical protein
VKSIELKPKKIQGRDIQARNVPRFLYFYLNLIVYFDLFFYFCDSKI